MSSRTRKSARRLFKNHLLSWFLPPPSINTFISIKSLLVEFSMPPEFSRGHLGQEKRRAIFHYCWLTKLFFVSSHLNAPRIHSSTHQKCCYDPSTKTRRPASWKPAGSMTWSPSPPCWPKTPLSFLTRASPKSAISSSWPREPVALTLSTGSYFTIAQPFPSPSFLPPFPPPPPSLPLPPPASSISTARIERGKAP